jgi:phospholipid transport system substrate-binding protein
MALARRPLLLITAAGLLQALAARTRAGAPSASDTVADLATQATTVLTATPIGSAERRRELERLLSAHFDMPTIARLTLGRHWRELTPADRKRYTDLFERFVLGTYAVRLDGYAGQTLRLVGERPANEDVMVESRLEGGSDGPIRLDWRLRRQGEQWVIIDLLIEGISLVVTQRNEFAALIERGRGVDALMRELEQRVGGGI